MIAMAVVCASALLVIWLIYPAAMAALARAYGRRRDGGFAWPSLPSVAVVLATREDEATIRARVENLLDADYPPSKLSVIVALDRRGPNTTVLLSPMGPAVNVVHGDEPGGKAATLNAAVRSANAELLVFADSQQRFAGDAIRELVHALADPSLGAVSGALALPGDGDGRRSLAEHYWRYERDLRRNEAAVHSAVGVSGSIYAMRRELWAPLPAELILDDVFVPMRLVLDGHRVGFTERAWAADDRRTEPGQEYRRKVRTLTGNIQLCAWLPAVLNPMRNPIWLQFVCHKPLRLLTPYLLLGVLLGTLGAVLVQLSAAQLLWMLGIVLLALAAAAARPVLRHRLRALAVWSWWLQAAVVVATINGMRGRWNVWR